jgi:superfamily II DNA helicase RecQ
LLCFFLGSKYKLDGEKSVSQVVEALQKAGADARPYHAKMSNKLRTEVHRFSLIDSEVVWLSESTLQ